MNTRSVNPYSTNFRRLRFVLMIGILLIISIHKVCAQSSEYRSQANKILNQVFKKSVPNSYVLFSKESKDYIIVERNKNGYKEHFVKVDSNDGIKKVATKFINKSVTLDRAFNKEIYHQEYINSSSDYFISPYAFRGIESVYFYHKNEDGKIYGEANLYAIVHPNPIDLSVFGYLLNELSNSIN